ncbi:MAG TPA: hypothetical protein VMW52_11750, partial [Phycisphaerae bacterium]|nr:hypothetical protein [Phycisphaerae bacterium]
MTAHAYVRGWPIRFNGRRWVNEDGRTIDERRPCRRCNRRPTPEGHDACLGKLPGVISACCGHGVEPLF